MEKISTNNNLIQLLYQESTLREEITLKRTMANDSDLRADYEMLKEAKQRLPKALFIPSDSVLENILNYSRKAAHEHYCWTKKFYFCTVTSL